MWVKLSTTAVDQWSALESCVRQQLTLRPRGGLLSSFSSVSWGGVSSNQRPHCSSRTLCPQLCWLAYEYTHISGHSTLYNESPSLCTEAVVNAANTCGISGTMGMNTSFLLKVRDHAGHRHPVSGPSGCWRYNTNIHTRFPSWGKKGSKRGNVKTTHIIQIWSCREQLAGGSWGRRRPSACTCDGTVPLIVEQAVSWSVI